MKSSSGYAHNRIRHVAAKPFNVSLRMRVAAALSGIVGRWRNSFEAGEEIVREMKSA